MKSNVFLALAITAAVLAVSSTSLRATETDDRIEASFKKSFVYETYLKDDHVKIGSKDGVVTLSGSVSNETHKQMAQDTSEALPGVKSVDNRIEVTGARPAESSDTWVSTKVTMALLFHSNVNASKTKVHVKDGIVTLSGEAASQAQKDLTTKYARDIVGVKGVNNEMTVAMASTKPDQTLGEKIDDASITAQVKMTLMLHSSTGVLRTTVTTADGVVTVGGKARNAAEKDLVANLVEDIHGVRSVVNNMTIEEPKNK